MIKILSASQIREIDRFTIINEPILSINLMERAALSLFNKIASTYSKSKFTILAGPGNNGGDAVALFRMMKKSSYNAELLIVNPTDIFSDDCRINILRLNEYSLNYHNVRTIDDLPQIDSNSIIIDGIFGVGLSRPVEGFFADIIDYVNKLPNYKISIDIPSGLFDSDNRKNHGARFMANETYTFQYPKLAFFFPENSSCVGQWAILDIGLSKAAEQLASTNYYYIGQNDIVAMYKSRPQFAHKASFGHSLVVAGSDGKYGAMILCSRACLRSGAGLVSVYTDINGQAALNTTIPEAMKFDSSSTHVSKPIDSFAAIAIGPGIGTTQQSEQLLAGVINNCRKPIVLDADALNIISNNSKLVEHIPHNSIFTPHVGEFDRMFGKSVSTYERLEKASEFCQKHNHIIIIKGAYTAVVDNYGTVTFNSTGNQGMATAGSGDVLTGIITGLLSSGYKPREAAIAGVWLHGKAGDYALAVESYESLIASDIVKNIGKAFKLISR